MNSEKQQNEKKVRAENVGFCIGFQVVVWVILALACYSLGISAWLVHVLCPVFLVLSGRHFYKKDRSTKDEHMINAWWNFSLAAMCCVGMRLVLSTFGVSQAFVLLPWLVCAAVSICTFKRRIRIINVTNEKRVVAILALGAFLLIKVIVPNCSPLVACMASLFCLALLAELFFLHGFSHIDVCKDAEDTP